MIEATAQLFDLLNAIITLLAAIIGAYFTMQVFHGERKADAANRRLEKVYGPLFVLVEPHLFKKLPRDKCEIIVAEIEKIAYAGSYLADPILKTLIQEFRKAKDCTPKEADAYKYTSHFFTDTPECYLEYWFRICNHIDQTYDQLCITCSYPLRTRGYRLDHMQYKTSARRKLALIRFYAPAISWFALTLTLLSIISQI